MMLDELLSPPSVASLLGVSPPTVYAAVGRAEPRFEHIRTPGNQIRIQRREVLAYCHRAGLEVPRGLVPARPPVVVLHPDRAVGQRVRSILEPACLVETYTDEVEGLVAIGGLAPPQVIVSERYGTELVHRLCRAIAEISEIGYMSVILLVGEELRRWRGGVVPAPLRVTEPRSAADSDLREVVSSLLGLS